MVSDELSRQTEKRLFLHDQLAYTNAKFALRYISSERGNSAKDSAKTDVYTRAGEYVIETMDALGYGKMEPAGYDALMKKGNGLITELINKGLIMKSANDLQPDVGYVNTIKYLSVLMTRLSEKNIDLTEEGLPDDFVRLKAVDKACAVWEHAASKDKNLNRKISADDFMDIYHNYSLKSTMETVDRMKEKIARDMEPTMRADLLNGAAYSTYCSLAHFNSELSKAADKSKIELYERGARLAMKIYDTLISEDPLHASKKLYEMEREMFVTNSNTDLSKNQSWELETISGKLSAYKGLVKEASDLLLDVEKRELVKPDASVGDAEDIDMDLLVIMSEQTKMLVEEMYGSTVYLFENQFAPARMSYESMGEAVAQKCRSMYELESALADEFREHSALYYTGNAILRHYDGKKVSSDVFDGCYGDVSRAMKEGISPEKYSASWKGV